MIPPNPYPEVTSAGGVLINDDAQILFCHPTGASMSRWAMPKGRMDPGETFEQAAMREVLEETGYRAEIIAPLLTKVQYITNVRGGTSVLKNLVMYLMKPLEKIQEPDWEHDKFQWVDFEKADDYAYERERPLIHEAIDLYRALHS